MMNRIWATLLCMMIAGAFGASAKPSLQFNSDGTFKILQLTDLHVELGKAKSQVAYENMRKVIAAESPNLIVITGDLIFSKPADVMYKQVLDSVNQWGIPFVITYGNHDRQFGNTNAQLQKIAESYPFFVGSSVKGIHGDGNCRLAVKNQKDKDTFAIYCFDSGEHSLLNNAGLYDYIHADQIEWYKKCSAKDRKKNGGRPLPAIAFFHIPVPEYDIAVKTDSCVRIGTHGEKPCIPDLNSGLFTAMKEMGDVMATFCGHDHDNDFAVNYLGILLAYGRFSGGDTVYNNLKPTGARVILIKNGEVGFKTWVRLINGEVIIPSHFPADYLK